MTTPRGTIVYLDPWIVDNPTCPIALDDIDRADLVCVTHGHSDHLGNAIEIVHKTKATLVTLPEVAAYCSNYGIPYDDKGGCLHTGGSIVQKDVRIHAVFALHSSDIMGQEYADHNQLMPGSGTCGMILTPKDGASVYFAGDTGVFGDMALIGKLYQPQVAVLPIGGKYTMGVYEAAYAMELLGSKVLIPGHYNTFPVNVADTDDLIRQVAVRCPQARVVVLDPGASWTVD
jgi:L-ascorbate metabolism protein UlaG (beta-lactamase superfamily)